MKYLKNFMTMLVEGIKSYDVELLSEGDFIVKYIFSDLDGNEYLVQFKNDTIGPKNNPKLGTSYELTYFVWDDEIEDWSISKIVNSNVFRVMKTIFGEIVPLFLSRNPWISMLRFEGLAKKDESGFITQRTRLYTRYLSNNPIDGYRVESHGNRISLLKIKR